MTSIYLSFFSWLKNNLYLLCLLIGLIHSAQAVPLLRFGTFHRSEQMPHRVLLKQVYQKLNIPISFVYLPGERSLTLANSGELDGEVARMAGLEKNYPNLVRVNAPFQTVILYAYSKNQAINVTDWQSLKPYRIAYVRGVKAIEKQFAGFRLEAVTNIQQAFTMLIHDRVDIVITGDEISVTKDMSASLNKMGIKKPTVPIYQFSVYHYVNKKHRDLIPQLEKVLTEMKQRKSKDSQ